MCRYNTDFDKYESLPGWAKETLYIHEMDKREYLYSLNEFEYARTHDPLLNSAQIQLISKVRSITI